MLPLTNELLPEIVELVEKKKIGRRLGYVYDQIPRKDCQTCTDCCFASPQVYLVEFLNILAGLKERSSEELAEFGRRAVRYEFTNLISLDEPCPLLVEEKCLAYSQMPLQCRLVGLYPDQDYQEMREASAKRNESLARYYARNHRVLLPESVIMHDVDQCRDNLAEDGSRIVISAVERDLLHNQIVAQEVYMVPEDFNDSQPEMLRFSHLFAKLFLEENEIEDLITETVKEGVEHKRTTKLDKMMAEREFMVDLGDLAKVK